MRRFSAIVVIGAMLGLLSSCVTRGKHANTVDAWEDRHGKLAQKSENEIKNRDKKISDLETELEVYKESSESQRADLQDKLAKRKAEIEKRKAEIAALRKQQEQIKANLAQYRRLREAFNKMIDAGELEVYHRRGRIMVALPSSVLFASGKASLSRAGRQAVASVARVLARLDGRRFLVAGHTDNVPIRTAKFADNWALSAARATTVTRDLVANGMVPTSVAAAGYGQHDPIRPNDSKENKKRNRRIEIILMPSIEELPELPE